MEWNRWGLTLLETRAVRTLVSERVRSHFSLSGAERCGSARKQGTNSSFLGGGEGRHRGREEEIMCEGEKERKKESATISEGAYE